MKSRNKRRAIFGILILLGLIAIVASDRMLRRILIDRSKQDASNLLFYYNEKIMLQMHGTLNVGNGLAETARIMETFDTAWFDKGAAPLLEREEIRCIYLFEGDTLVNALPETDNKSLLGKDIKDFSYVYTLAKVVKELVVEGPVTMASGEEVFLFLQPFLYKDAYLGEVVVVMDSGYVLEQIGLNELAAQGYDYELWRVESQNGEKEIISVSGSGIDFSNAAKTVFYLPSQWNLSIQPRNGWLSRSQETGILLLCSCTIVLFFTLGYLLYLVTDRERKQKRQQFVDSRSGLYTYDGFVQELNLWLTKESSPVMLFYFVYEEYNQISQLIGPREEEQFLKSIPGRLDAYVQSPFLAGRLGAGNFMLAVREKMNDEQREDFAKGLSLELFLKTRLNGVRNFLTARYQYVCCEPGGCRTEDRISSLIRAYYARLSQESPARMMNEKCLQLIEGKSDVIFEEYTDFEMMELSKNFNRYRKQVEQLAYFDPIFNVGNRSKYMRDANMLISYDKKRTFSLFCVDICSFNQYNELFSAEVGDEILHVVLQRLARPFGSYLYRINGDVFLGISLSGESMESLTDRLQQMLTRPAAVENIAISLQVRTVACQYPMHGKSPIALLDCLQAALRYAKKVEEKTVIYNEQLSEMFKTQSDILHRLKSSIQNQTLEVWYQPIKLLEKKCYNAAEALVRLPDGNGGYFNAGQVISIAESNQMVEQLGDYVLRRACTLMEKCGSSLGLCRMSVNLSAQQLLVSGSAQHLLKLIHETGVETKRITLEVTESVLIQSMEGASKTLNKLRASGIHIALDDFGVGYSSLNYLSNLPVDVIKIDRSLTQQILTSTKQRALLKSIVEMAAINSLLVVAEGVETEAEQQLIAASGVQYIQGYYYARPMAEEDFGQFLLRHREEE